MNKAQASQAGTALALRKAQKQTKAQRSEGARKAANARWRAVREAKRRAAAAAAETAEA
jgi:hypothetical protein